MFWLYCIIVVNECLCLTFCVNTHTYLVFNVKLWSYSWLFIVANNTFPIFVCSSIWTESIWLKIRPISCRKKIYIWPNSLSDSPNEINNNPIVQWSKVSEMLQTTSQVNKNQSCTTKSILTWFYLKINLKIHSHPAMHCTKKMLCTTKC